MTMVVDLLDQIETMLQQEVTTYRTVDYLAPGFQQSLAAEIADSSQEPLDQLLDDTSLSTGGGSSSSTAISEMWREKICEWCYQVIDHFDFSREVVSVAMHYLDRYLSRRIVSKRIFQLAAMAALSLAVKLNEPSKLSMSSMIELSRGYFTVKQMEAMERSLMRELGWRLHPPTAYGLTKHFLYLLPLPTMSSDVRHAILELSRFLNELSVIDYFFVAQRPSHVSVAAICNAMQEIAAVTEETRRDFTELMSTLSIDLQDPAIADCRHRLRLLYQQGGYTPPLPTTSVGTERPDSTPSPVCVSYGTEAYQNQANSQQGAAAEQRHSENKEDFEQHHAQQQRDSPQE